ncbi:hypothetical protein ABEB36_015637 [Hypothenemus hampei]|uniref:Uncharacterized protein n=1 Tax=Hypothenemus hampei TaxID=57062 RepID=A0ABD1DZV9_HYPHA
MQILNLSNEELDQFSQFMGHTGKTHNEYYKLPQDVYQTAKVSKLLLLMEKGADKYKGKSLKEIDINPQVELAEEDSDNDIENSVALETKGTNEMIANDLTSKDEHVGDGKKKLGPGRTQWNEDQIKLVKQHFKEHIRTKTAPKKQECLKLYEEYPTILHNKDWVRIKTFVYNCYRQK